MSFDTSLSSFGRVAGEYKADAAILETVNSWKGHPLADSLAPSDLSSIFAGWPLYMLLIVIMGFCTLECGPFHVP